MVDHLLAVKPSGHQRIDEYRARVAEILDLDRKTDADVVGSAMCMPAFDPEWVLHLLRPKDGHCSIELKIAAANIWFTETNDPIILYRRDIPPDVLGAIDAVWRFMLDNVRVAENAETGLDGTRYYFYRHTCSGSFQAGQSWSPDPHTIPGRAVNLLDALHEFTANGADSHIPQWLRWRWSLGKITRSPMVSQTDRHVGRCGITRGRTCSFPLGTTLAAGVSERYVCRQKEVA